MKKITSILYDKKINSKNIQFCMPIKDYVNLANQILINNDFQRNRVKNSNSIYNLLKDDIKNGCLIPPIVLASRAEVDVLTEEEQQLNKALELNNSLIILDGLQRTYSIIDVYQNNVSFFDSLEEQYLIRAEIYLAISEYGILYRMLTLNTGQTPMSLRHQLEILYKHYLDGRIGDINIIREVDESVIKGIYDYRFSDLIDGYTSLLERNELALDRFDILQTVKTIEFISKDCKKQIEFNDFVKIYNLLTEKVSARFKNWEYPVESGENEIPNYLKIKSNPFGKNIYKIFNKSQPLTGFGAALGELIDLESIENSEAIHKVIDELVFDDDDLLYLNKYLDEVKEKSRKIGTGQRIFFKLFFKFLMDKDGSTFKNFKKSLEKAKNRALAEV